MNVNKIDKLETVSMNVDVYNSLVDALKNAASIIEKMETEEAKQWVETYAKKD